MAEKTRLDEDIDHAKRIVIDAKDEIHSAAPHWLIQLVKDVISDIRTPWFVLGMAAEAVLMLGTFYIYGTEVPIVDFIGWAFICGCLLFIQRAAPADIERPGSLRKGLSDFLYHPALPWFFGGMATEALGVSAQFTFFGWAYVVGDAIIGLVIFLVLRFYQKRSAGCCVN